MSPVVARSSRARHRSAFAGSSCVKNLRNTLASTKACEDRSAILQCPRDPCACGSRRLFTHLLEVLRPAARSDRSVPAEEATLDRLHRRSLPPNLELDDIGLAQPQCVPNGLRDRHLTLGRNDRSRLHPHTSLPYLRVR